MFRSPFHRVRSFVFAATAALIVAAIPAAVQAKDQAPEVPADIEVPEGNKVHFHGYAEGVQIYTWNGTSWGASVPEAVLFDKNDKIVAIHYGGPTWENKHGKVIGMVAAPRVTVDPDAIPWLLLAAVDTEGHGVFADTTFIHRVNTVGGKAPAVAGDFVGQVVRVPYAADYYFYKKH